MADINFIVLKINGIDISEMPHSDAVQMFLMASEPMNLEVRRPISDDLNKSHVSNGYFPPFTCVISPSPTLSSPSLRPPNSPQQQYPCKADSSLRSSPVTVTINKTYLEKEDENELPLDDDDVVKDSSTSITVTGSPSSGSIDRKSFVSTGIQTDTIIAEYIFSDASIDDQSNEHIFDEGLPPEIDIEEVTLQKSASHEKLGLTVSYSSGSDDTDTCTEVYISDIIPNSVAARDGRLRQGDQILQVNGRDVSGKEDTETLIAENKNAVTFLVSRYLYVDDDLHTSYDDYDNDIAQQTYQNCLSSSPTKVRSNGFSVIGELRSSSEQTNSNTSRSSSSHKSGTEITEIGTGNAKDKVKILIDPLDHVNIEAHLESVNKELAQLTSRMENSMMLHNSISGSGWKCGKASNSAIMSSASLPKAGQHLNIYRTPIDNVAKLTSSAVAANTIDTMTFNTTPVASNMKLTNPRSNCNKKQIESDTEHIYETIPEDIESEPFYCLPYEAVEQNLVEQWLEMQHCQQQLLLHHQQQLNEVETPVKAAGIRGGSKKDRSGLLLQQIKAISSNMRCQPSSSLKTMKSNSSGEDHENSSSAYNTGGSCNSNNHLALEMNSNEEGGVCDMLGYHQRAAAALHIPSGSQQCPEDCAGTYIQDINDNCEECQRQKKDKVATSPKHDPAQQKSPQKSQRLPNLKQHCPLTIPIIHSGSQQRVLDQTLLKSPEISADTMYTNMANLKRTMLLQQKLFRQTLIRQNSALGQTSHTTVAGGAKVTSSTDRLHFNAPNLSQYHFVSSQEVSAIQAKQTTCEEAPMVWKVKRRQDGTRYIVRRPARNRILRERAIRLTTERNDQTTEDDTISEIKTGRYWTREERKKHIERAKERRQRQQQQQSASFNKCESTDNTLLSSAPATATIVRKPQGRLTSGHPSLNPLPGTVGQNKCPAFSTTQTLDCPFTQKKSIKKKKKDENPTSAVSESNNKMVGLLSVTTV